jgi:hypothetical protein
LNRRDRLKINGMREKPAGTGDGQSPEADRSSSPRRSTFCVPAFRSVICQDTLVLGIRSMRVRPRCMPRVLAEARPCRFGALGCATPHRLHACRAALGWRDFAKWLGYASDRANERWHHTKLAATIDRGRVVARSSRWSKPRSVCRRIAAALLIPASRGRRKGLQLRIPSMRGCVGSSPASASRRDTRRRPATFHRCYYYRDG